MEESGYKYELVVDDSTVKYSTFGFGTTFTNIASYFSSKLKETDKNLLQYFKTIKHIIHVDEGEFEYTGVTFNVIGDNTIYQIHLKHI